MQKTTAEHGTDVTEETQALIFKTKKLHNLNSFYFNSR